MFRFIVVFLFLAPTLVALGQNEPMFSEYLLDNPIESSQWFDSILELVYVDVFEEPNSTRTICLENGYAQHLFSDGANLSHRYWGATPVSVDVVYTRYPFNRVDWQTNYFMLLANRLKELFQFDPTLNSTRIKWRLVMQTSGKTGDEAEKLFHGVVVSYTPQVLSTLPAISLNPIKLPQVETKPSRVLVDQVNKSTLNSSELEVILYPETVYNRDMKQQIPEKQGYKKEPRCSKFTTRAHRPRRGLWARLFR